MSDNENKTMDNGIENIENGGNTRRVSPLVSLALVLAAFVILILAAIGINNDDPTGGWNNPGLNVEHTDIPSDSNNEYAPDDIDTSNVKHPTRPTEDKIIEPIHPDYGSGAVLIPETTIEETVKGEVDENGESISGEPVDVIKTIIPAHYEVDTTDGNRATVKYIFNEDGNIIDLDGNVVNSDTLQIDEMGRLFLENGVLDTNNVLEVFVYDGDTTTTGSSSANSDNPINLVPASGYSIYESEDLDLNIFSIFRGREVDFIDTKNITDRYIIVETSVDFNNLNYLMVIKNK